MKDAFHRLHLEDPGLGQFLFPLVPVEEKISTYKRSLTDELSKEALIFLPHELNVERTMPDVERISICDGLVFSRSLFEEVLPLIQQEVACVNYGSLRAVPPGTSHVIQVVEAAHKRPELLEELEGVVTRSVKECILVQIISHDSVLASITSKIVRDRARPEVVRRVEDPVFDRDAVAGKHLIMPNDMPGRRVFVSSELAERFKEFNAKGVRIGVPIPVSN